MLRPSPQNLPMSDRADDNNDPKAQLAAEIARIEAELAAKKREHQAAKNKRVELLKKNHHQQQQQQQQQQEQPPAWHDYSNREEDILFDETSVAEEYILQEEQAFAAEARASKEQKLQQPQVQPPLEQQVPSPPPEPTQVQAPPPVAVQEEQQLPPPQKETPSAKELQRLKLEAEIKAMEAAIQAAAQRKKAKKKVVRKKVPPKASPQPSVVSAVAPKSPAASAPKSPAPSVATTAPPKSPAPSVKSPVTISTTTTASSSASVASTGRAGFLASVTQAALDRSDRMADDPVLLQEVPAQKSPSSPSPGRAGFLASVTQAALDRSDRIEDEPVVIQETVVPSSSPAKRKIASSSSSSVASVGRAGFLESVKQAALDRSDRMEDEPIVIQEAVVHRTPKKKLPMASASVGSKRPPASPTKRPNRSSSSVASTGRAGFLASVTQAALERSDRMMDDPIVLTETVAPSSPAGGLDSFLANQGAGVPRAGGRASFLASVTQAAIERSDRVSDEPAIIQEATAPPIPSPRSSRAGFLSQIRQAAQDRSDRVEDEPTLIEVTVASPVSGRAEFLASIQQAAVDLSGRGQDEAAEIQEAPSPALAGERSGLLVGMQLAAQERADRLEGEEPLVVPVSSAVPKTSLNPLLAAISSAAGEREARLEETDGELKIKKVEEPEEPADERPAFLAAIMEVATAREQRLEETGGELIMQEFEPEIKERVATTPQLAFSLAEMVTKKALDREKRLEEGGQKKITIIKEKEEYQKEFNNICTEAASMGRLTRLNEEVVESVAVEKTPEEEWHSSGLLAIQWRSNHMSIIHEAAMFGAQTKCPEKVVSNYAEEEEDWDYEQEEMSPRMQQLLELDKVVGEGQHKVDKLVLGRKEENIDPTSMLVRPMRFYNNLEEVALPKPKPPTINLEKIKRRNRTRQEEANRARRPMIDIGNDVAERAWERRTRLDRPGNLPKMKEKCICPYCETASPFQTFAYREIDRRQKHEIQNKKEKEEAEMSRRQEERERREKEETERLVQEEQERAERQAQVAQRTEGSEQFTGVVANDTAIKPVLAPEQPSGQQETAIAAPSADQGCACIIL